MASHERTSPVQIVDYSVYDGIARLHIDDPDQKVNTMTGAFLESLHEAVNHLEADAPQLRGAIISSGKPTFLAGGDLHRMMARTAADRETAFSEVEAVKADLRRIETIGIPVVAVINGAALGGGLELALATHRRVAVAGDYGIGLPEVTLGLLPGGGGVSRTVRMLGLTRALNEVLLPGRHLRPEAALSLGLVDEVVERPEDLFTAATTWIDFAATSGQPVQQPWDRPGYQLPGGTPSELGAVVATLPALLREQLRGADVRAPKSILCCAVEGAAVDLDTALRIESRYLTELVVGQQFKNMAQGLFFDLRTVQSRKASPSLVNRLGIVGSGMMGAGIGLVAAEAGIDVVLIDVSMEKAKRGREYAAERLDKKVRAGRLSSQISDVVLARITPTADYADLARCDFVVEAVFESVELKQDVLASIDKFSGGAIIGSNTSSLPISALAESVTKPEEFVGVHFFSPVERMDLVEVIVGSKTSPATVDRAVALAKQLRKTAIVVNDSRGFFTSRVFERLVMEAVHLVAEGVDPVLVERAAWMAGFPGQPLAMIDEVTLTLIQSIQQAAHAAAEAAGQPQAPTPAEDVLNTMISRGRGGRAAGAGFYDYPADKDKVLWPGVRELYTRDDNPVPLVDVMDRLTFVMAVETLRCMEEGVLQTVPEANVGSVLGIGFPRQHGGALQFVRGYEGADGRTGVGAFAWRSAQLAAAYGHRFDPPRSLLEGSLVGP